MKIAPLLAPLLLLIACGSDDPAAPDEYIPSFVSGYLRHDDTAHTPIAHAEMTLAQFKFDEDDIIDGWTQTSWHMTTCTRSDGYFSFKYDAREKNLYRVMTCGSAWLCSFVDVPHGTKKNLHVDVNRFEDITPCP